MGRKIESSRRPCQPMLASSSLKAQWSGAIFTSLYANDACSRANHSTKTLERTRDFFHITPMQYTWVWPDSSLVRLSSGGRQLHDSGATAPRVSNVYQIECPSLPFVTRMCDAEKNGEEELVCFRLVSFVWKIMSRHQRRRP